MKLGLETEYRIVLDIRENLIEDFWIEFFRILKEDYGAKPGFYGSYDYQNNFIYFLPNGGKVYLDFSPNSDSYALEYATPECSSPDELVNYEFSFICLVDDVFRKIMRSLNLTQTNSYIALFKTNRDKESNLSGCHENYEVSNEIYKILLDEDHPIVKKLFLPLLLSRIIFSGNGWWENNVFKLSQRIEFTKFYLKGCEVCHPLGIKERGIIDVRDEHFDKNKKRLHLLLGDANISPFSTKIKTQIVVLLINWLEREIKNGSDLEKIKLNNQLKKIDIQDFEVYNRYNKFNDLKDTLLNVLNFITNNNNRSSINSILDDIKNYDWGLKKYYLDRAQNAQKKKK